MSQENKPYQELIASDFIYRKFTQDVDEDELVWHRDENDREIEVLGHTDWQFQLEDSIPQNLQDVLFIPKNTYHRLIKGTQDLDLKILEL